ncbi:MAG: TOMM precursor leader peptide-binding protein [Alphaproteobacteria bacterium]|nr:TOMM precursor leader peptide-binding protein [Alphaproteobacteria bacterium]
MRDNNLQAPLRISPQFSVHVVGERQVLLLSEQRSFRLSGKLYVALLPYLDGSRDEDEIVRAFARVPEDRLRAALSNMIAKGYVCAVDRLAPTSRQAMWVELGVVPAQAERALVQQSIAVMALPGSEAMSDAARLLARAALETGLTVATEQTPSFTVVCTDDYLHRDLGPLNATMRKAGRAWLPFKPGGSMPLLGPLFRPDRPTCWTCVAERMLENRPGDRVVPPVVKMVRPALAYTASSLSLAVNFAALEMARTIAQDGLEGLEPRIVSLDLKGYERREHFVRPDPACPVCGEPYDAQKTLEQALLPIQLQARPMLAHSDGGWRISTADEVVKRLSRYVSPVTGIIADVTDTSPRADLPVFQARQTNPVAASPRENRLLGRPGAAAGKGMEKAQAQASCLAEAIERHLCGFTGREPRRRATWADVAAEAPHPYSFLHYSERQYDRREEWNKSNSGFNWVGERFDENRAIEWTPAWSLTHGKRRWLPTRYCYFNYYDQAAQADEEENKLCHGDSNGCASGSTVEEAILQGFLELVERDACALWWYNRVRRPAFDLEAIDSAFVRRVRAFCARTGRGLHVLDLTNDLAIPVAIAVSYSQATGKGIALGLGAHFDAEIAIGRALAEMNQMLTLESEAGKLLEEHKLDGDNKAMVDWTLNHSLDTEPYCVPVGTVRSDLHPRPSISDLKEAVDLCNRRVAEKGFEMIVLDHSRPEIDFAAARVVVPGLRHFWARLRAGRLYDAPAALGWVESPLDEETVNPLPFFL